MSPLKYIFSFVLFFSVFACFAQNTRFEYYRYCENFQHPLLSKTRFKITKEKDTILGRCFRFAYSTDSKNIETLQSITHLFLGKEQPILNNDVIVGLDYETLSLSKVSKIVFKYTEKYILESIKFFNNNGKETPNVWGVSQYKYEPLKDSKSSDLFEQKRLCEDVEKHEKLAYIYKLKHEIIPNGANKKMRVWTEIKRMNFNIFREYKYDFKNSQVSEIEYSENGYFKKVTILDQKYMYEKESACYNTDLKDSVSFFKDGNYHKKTTELKEFEDVIQLTTNYWADGNSKLPQAFESDGYQQKIEKFKNGFMIESVELKNLTPEQNKLKVNQIFYSYDDEKPGSFVYTKSYKKKDGDPITIFNSEFPNKSEKFEFNNQGMLLSHRIAKPDDYSFYGENYEILYEPEQNFSSYKIVYKRRKNLDLINNINLTPDGLLKKVSFFQGNGNETTNYHNLASYLGRYDLYEFENFKAFEVDYKSNKEVSNISITKENGYVSTFNFEYREDGKQVIITKDKLKANINKRYTFNYSLFNYKYVTQSLTCDEVNGSNVRLNWKEVYDYVDNIVKLTKTDENGKVSIDKYIYYKNTSFLKENSRHNVVDGYLKPALYEGWWLTPHKIIYSFDKNLNVIATKYYDAKNNMISQFDNDFVYYDSVIYDNRNLIKLKHFLGSNHQIIKDHNLIDGYCSVEYEYNDRNQCIAQAFYLIDQPVTINSVWKHYKNVDAFGRNIKEYRLDTEKRELTQDNDSYSKIEYKYSDVSENYRKIISKSYFKLDKPAINGEGYHEIRFEYDKSTGVNSGYKYFGLVNGKVVPINKKRTNFHYEKIQTSDTLIQKSFFNIDEKPTTEFETSNLHMFKFWPNKDFNDRNNKEEFYGVDGQLIDFINKENNLTYAVGEYQFNDSGDTTLVKRYLKDYSLLDGYYVEIKYLTERSQLQNPDLEKIVEYHYKTSPSNYVKKDIQVKQYLFYSNKTEVRNLSEKKKKVEDNYGVASYILDKFGSIIEKYDAKEKRIN